MHIVAEMGVNWKTPEQASFMMGMLKGIGIKYIKFQLFLPEMVQEELRTMVITEDLARYLFETGQEYNTEVFFSVMYPEAIDICERIGVNFYKLRYQDQNNLILYRKLKKIKNINKKTIFVSCKKPQNTIFWNWFKYNKNIKFLYCVPKYPAKYEDYIYYPYFLKNGIYTINPNFSGISDHISNIKLFKVFLKAYHYVKDKWFEMHVCVDKETAYEGKWSKTFQELKEVLFR